MSKLAIAPSICPPLPLESVLTTDELATRPSREADFSTENQVLLKLAASMAVAPSRLLQELVDHARTLCRAGSAGISLLDPEPPDAAVQFRWIATSGEFKRYAGNTMPRDFSPCGSVLDANQMLLMRDPIRHFPYIKELSHPVCEVLLVPFYRGTDPIGTIWVATHAPDRTFDREDARVVTSLAQFAAMAIHVITTSDQKLTQLAEDVVQRKQAEAALAADLTDTRKLRDLAARLISDEDTSALVDEILLAAMEITEADAGTIQVLDAETQILGFLASRGFDKQEQARFRGVDATSGSPGGVALARGERSFVLFDDPSVPDPDGAIQWHREAGLNCAQSTPLASRSGRQLGMLSTHWRGRRELTERQLRFLDLLARQAADLIERAQAQDALRTSEKKLREADRRKDEFLAVLAHELRNPLAPLRTGVELLQHAKEKPELIEKICPMMERQLCHVVRLIDDLLEVSRITTGKIEFQPQRVSIASLVGNAVEANGQAITDANLTLSMQFEDPQQMLNVDPVRFSQVISNILHNATKFTPPGGRISISTSIETAEPDLLQLVIDIADTGIGIESHHLSEVFGLFTQLHRGDVPRGGLGIGLALSRSLIEMHGGSIAVRSEGRDRGSCFTVRVPVARPIKPMPQPQAFSRHVLQGQRVLIADDNRDAADSMGMLITQIGGAVRVAYDGESALEVLQEFPASFVLLDIGMPGLDGYQTCRRIRASKGHTVSIIAISGWGQKADRSKAEDAGFDAHLTKPVDPMQLATLPLPRG